MVVVLRHIGTTAYDLNRLNMLDLDTSLKETVRGLNGRFLAVLIEMSIEVLQEGV